MFTQSILRINSKLNMDRPILYYMNISPPCRAVKMVIEKLNIDTEIKIVDLTKFENTSEEIHQLNPMKLIPILQHRDLILNDSHAINPYLTDFYSRGNSLYPEDLKARAKINQMLAFDMTTLFPRSSFLIKDFIANGHRAKQNKESYRSMDEALGFIERFLENRKWIAGDKISLADYSCITSITTTQLMMEIPQRYKKLSRWIENCENLPEFKKANTEGLEKLREVVNSIVPS